MGLVPGLGSVFEFSLLEVAVIVVIVVHSEVNECITVFSINAGSLHDTNEHVFTEFHLGCAGLFGCSILTAVFF